MGTLFQCVSGESDRNIILASHFHLVPRPIMCGALPPRPTYASMVWCFIITNASLLRALYKKSQHTTFRAPKRFMFSYEWRKRAGCVSFFFELELVCETFFARINIWRITFGMRAGTWVGLHVKCPLFCLVLTKMEKCHQILVKSSNIKYHQKALSGSRAVTWELTDGQTWRS
jgi:hypothetical protein